jgi:hypothetical protein
MSTRRLIPAQLFRPLLGQKPWRVALGYGSFVTFEFGKKIKDGVGEYGAWHLWIYMCDWKLLKAGKVVADSEMPREQVANIVPQLQGRALRQVRISDDLLRTDFRFDGGVVLRCAAYADAKDDEEQWMLFIPGHKVLSNAGGALVLQKSDEPPHRVRAAPVLK